jgi:electron transfer flavoprotein alpha/beta subunit
MSAVVLVRGIVAPWEPEQRIALDAPSVVALCQALEWRAVSGARLTALTAGPVAWEAALREALALGADAAVRVDVPDGGPVDIAWTARALAGAIEDAAVVFAGAAASDCGSGLLPAAVAGCLDWPLMTGVVRVADAGGRLRAEVNAGAGARRVYECDAPAVLVSAGLVPPPVYAPLARRLAAGRASIRSLEPETALAPDGRSLFAGYGPGKPRTKHLLKPSATAQPGDRLSQLMAGGVQRSGSKLSGDAADLARQLVALLERSGLLTR